MRAGVAIAVVVAVGVLAAAPRQAAASQRLPGRAGLYLAQAGQPTSTAVASVDSQLEVVARGPLIEAVLRQRFVLGATGATEAVYIFPLPADAAVTAMRMRVGNRTLTARIEPRAQARARYERAVAQGLAGALLEQERPDIFTQSVTGLTAGATIEVELRWDAQATFGATGTAGAGEWELVLPLVVAPRYVPGRPTGGRDRGTGAASDTARSPDASRVAAPTTPGAGVPYQVRIALDPRTRSARCVTLTCAVARDEAALRLTAQAAGDRDVVVRWVAPSALAFSERDGEGGVIAIGVSGAAGPARAQPVAVVLAVDVSGSTAGQARLTSRQVVRALLTALRPGERVALDVGQGGLWAEAGGAARLEILGDDVRGPRDLVGLVESAGTTAAAAAARAPQVVLITDGLVSDDAAVIAASRRLGLPVHTIAVGAAAGHALLTGVAAATGGTTRRVDRLDDVAAVAAALATDLRTSPNGPDLDWGPLAVRDVAPARRPRLGVGQGMVVLARVDRLRRGVQVGALGAPVAIEPGPGPSASGGVLGATSTHGLLARRWAHARLRDLVGGEAPGRAAEATRIALGHGLVSPYTAMVAIGEEVVVQGGTTRTVTIPVALPVGMQWQAVFGVGGDATDPATSPRSGDQADGGDRGGGGAAGPSGGSSTGLGRGQADDDRTGGDGDSDKVAPAAAPAAIDRPSDDGDYAERGEVVADEATLTGAPLLGAGRRLGVSLGGGLTLAADPVPLVAADLRLTLGRDRLELGAELGLRVGLGAAGDTVGRGLLVVGGRPARAVTLGLGAGLELGARPALATSAGLWLGPGWLRVVLRLDGAVGAEVRRAGLSLGVEASF